MTNIGPASPEHCKALAAIISDQADATFAPAQRHETKGKALHRTARLLFDEADRLSPAEKLAADNDEADERLNGLIEIMGLMAAKIDYLIRISSDWIDPDLDEAA